MTEAPSPSERDARLARARRMLAAYGADPARWPDDARALYERYKDDYRFNAARSDAADIDGLLAAAPDEPASEALRMRLLAAAPDRKSARGLPLAFFASRLIPAGALAGLSMAGFMTGLASASLDAGGLAYAETAMSSVFDGGDGDWTEGGK